MHLGVEGHTDMQPGVRKKRGNRPGGRRFCQCVTRTSIGFLRIIVSLYQGG
jgi:hypothetical protein